MAVTWKWKAVRGEIHYYDEKHKQHFKLGLYGGNMMFAIIFRYWQTNEETHKRERWYNFILWFDDIKHLTRVLKDDKNFFNTMLITHPKVRKFRLNINSDNGYANKEMIQCAKVLSKYGYKVEVY